MLVERNTVVHQGWESRRGVLHHWDTFPGAIGKHYENIYVWEGDGTPTWPTDEDGNDLDKMRRLCTVEADLTDMISALQMKFGPNGEYLQLRFDVIVQFGATSMRSWMEWEEQGSRHKGPATLLPGMIF